MALRAAYIAENLTEKIRFEFSKNPLNFEFLTKFKYFLTVEYSNNF